MHDAPFEEHATRSVHSTQHSCFTSHWCALATGLSASNVFLLFPTHFLFPTHSSKRTCCCSPKCETVGRDAATLALCRGLGQHVDMCSSVAELAPELLSRNCPWTPLGSERFGTLVVLDKDFVNAQKVKFCARPHK